MKIGFTGTQLGMSNSQLNMVFNIMEMFELVEFHHGNCIGADEEAALIIKNSWTQCKIHSHPPEITNKESLITENDIIYGRKPYLVRNRNIVNYTDIMVAAPKENTEQLRSGTWYTIRYTLMVCKPIIIIYPNGTYNQYNITLDTYDANSYSIEHSIPEDE